MKKLRLGKLKLASEEVLQRSQLANIYGGSGGDCYWNGFWACKCNNGPEVTVMISDCLSVGEHDVMPECVGYIDCRRL